MNKRSYRASICPWTIVRYSSNLHPIGVGRFRSRSDAEGHVQVLRQLVPDARFVVVFDPNDVSEDGASRR